MLPKFQNLEFRVESVVGPISTSYYNFKKPMLLYIKMSHY